MERPPDGSDVFFLDGRSIGRSKQHWGALLLPGALRRVRQFPSPVLFWSSTLAAGAYAALPDARILFHETTNVTLALRLRGLSPFFSLGASWQYVWEGGQRKPLRRARKIQEHVVRLGVFSSWPDACCCWQLDLHESFY